MSHWPDVNVPWNKSNLVKAIKMIWNQNKGYLEKIYIFKKKKISYKIKKMSLLLNACLPTFLFYTRARARVCVCVNYYYANNSM